MTSPMEHARELAERDTEDPQGRNAAWWEALPMTYRQWDADDREQLTGDDFVALEATFLATNPWLRRDYSFEGQVGKRVLEIGCGTGVASCLFAKAGAEVTAIDITGWAVQLASANCEAQGLQMDVRQMDAENLDFPDGTFDYVFSWGVLHHTAHTESAYSELARVLRPGGECLTMVYNRNSLRYWVKGLQWLVLRGKKLAGYDLRSVQSFYTDGYYHRHFSRNELVDLHSRVGLRPVRMAVTHMSKRMVPIVPVFVDEWLKENAGWLLVTEAKK